jgi:inner membrane protein
MLVGAAAAAFPDLDFVTGYLTPLAYLHHHRGITHSLLLLPLWAAFVALIFAALWRFKPSFRAYLGIAAIGIAAHIAGDLITSFGTMIFAPLSDARYAASTTFIIDLWFSGIILAGLAASAAWRKTRAPAVIGLAVLAAYVGFQWTLQQQAIDFGKAYARQAGFDNARVSAVPRPVSPFNWTVFVEHGGRYRYAHVNLVRKAAPPEPSAGTSFIARLDAPYRPRHDARWAPAGVYGAGGDLDLDLAREAYTHPSFRFFRWFAAYPALLRVDSQKPAPCVWFHDLRFVTPGRATPFLYGMCREGNEGWRAFQLLGGARRAVY